MKRNKKIIFLLFFLIILSTVVVKADAPELITPIGGVGYPKNEPEWYCLEHSKQLPSNQEMRLVGQLDRGFLYIFDYPITEDIRTCHKYSQEEAENGQGCKKYYTLHKEYVKWEAIWSYATVTNQGSGGTKGEYLFIDQLVEKALSARDTYNPYTISLTEKTGKMALSQDSDYLLSNKIGVQSGVSDTYTVSIDNTNVAAKIVDEFGLERNTFNANEQFTVKILAKDISEIPSLSLTVSTNMDIYEIYKYEAADGDSSWQTIAAREMKENATVTSSIKVDSSFKNMLIIDGNTFPANNELVVKNSNGEEVERIKTNSDFYVMTSLKNGKYTIESVQPDTGDVKKSVVTMSNNIVTHLSNDDFNNNLLINSIFLYVVLAIIVIIIGYLCIRYFKKEKNKI